ncbi:MAG TPA: TlpA disulfide reductase family protein [Pseudogracilibacillus sp.]|nr:TlpA disulfide reductase family protein [Pseudogracilibacillus sp.]
MKKWIVIVVIAGMLSWVVYDFASSKGEEAVDTAGESVEVSSENGGEDIDSEKEVGLSQGDEAPDFELETLDGESVSLSDFRGEKVMVNFWATWCPPCRAEMPDMQDFHEDYDDAVILSVNLRETENSDRNVEEFLDEYGITFDVLSDEDSSVGNTYGAQALPTSYLINTDGTIDNKAVGPLNYDSMVQSFDEMD